MRDFRNRTATIAAAIILGLSVPTMVLGESKQEKSLRKEAEKLALSAPLAVTVKAGPDRAKAEVIRNMQVAGYNLTSDSQFALAFNRPTSNFGYSLGATMAGRSVDGLSEAVTVTFVPDASGENTAMNASCTMQEHNSVGSNNMAGCGKRAHLDVLSALNQAGQTLGVVGN